MSYLQIKAVTKAYDKPVLRDVSLEVQQGELVTLLGPSGCGKSTLLRLIAGFETLDGGQIMLGDQDLAQVPANRRNVGMVFQNYALFPNMTAFDNVAFGLKLRGVAPKEQAQRVHAMLRRVGLEAVANHYPHELSGGQQQRVALARAIVVEPRVLLLDEPLSALDAKIRARLRDLLRQVQRELGITTILVTHDQEEALSISDRVLVMQAGEVVQAGTPHEIYRHPRTRFVADFVGTFNFLNGEIWTGGRALAGGLLLPVDDGLSHRVGEQVEVAIRPESIRLHPPGTQVEGAACAEGTVESAQLLGNMVRLSLRLAETTLLVDQLHTSQLPAVGDVVTLAIHPDGVLLLDAGGNRVG